MRKAAALTAAVVVSFAATAAQAQEKVTISDLNWTGAKAIGHVIKAVIDGPLGSEAEIKQGLSDQAIVAEGMDKGDGSVDVYTDMWMPNQQAIWDKYIVEAKTVGHNEPYLGTQGMFVPHYMADRVKSFEDLAKPEIAAMFDKDGNGKGEYWAGDAGWKSTKMWQVKFKSYGPDRAVGAGDRLGCDVQGPSSRPPTRARSRSSSTTGHRSGSTPRTTFALWTSRRAPRAAWSLNLDQEDWLEASTFNCKHADANVYVAYSKSLEQRNPGRGEVPVADSARSGGGQWMDPENRARQGRPAGRRRRPGSRRTRTR